MLVSLATPPFSYAKYGLVTLVQRSLHDGMLMKIMIEEFLSLPNLPLRQSNTLGRVTE